MQPSLTLGENCGISSKIFAQTVSGPGRRREFEGLLQHLLPRFKRMALRWLRNQEDAEDAVQDAMLSALRHLDQFDGRSQMSTWLTSILRNAVLMQIRRRPRSQMASISGNTEDGELKFLDTLADPRPTPDQVLENSQRCQIVRRLRNTLPRQQRVVMNLRIQDDLSVKEVAKALDIPEGTVKAHLARGRVNLRERLNTAIAMPRMANQSCTKTKSKKSCSKRRNRYEYEQEIPAMLGFANQAGYELCAGV